MAYIKMEARFQNIREIRMGSPFNICDLTLKGNWSPDLPDYDWQDIYAKSYNNRYLALVAWDIRNNTPGFRVVIIDVKDKCLKETRRIPGCCEAIEGTTAGFSYTVSSFLHERDFEGLKEVKG